MNPKLTVFDGKNLVDVRELNDAEAEEFSKAFTHLHDFWADQRLFEVVRLNYDDFFAYYNRSSEIIKEGSPHTWLLLEEWNQNFNRLLLNYLASVRTFLDHSETKIHKRYGNNSPQFIRFKEACCNAYDNHFAYRFLYELRNYAQHCGLPIGVLKVGESLEVFFDRDYLLGNYKKWKRLENELMNCKPWFEVNSLLNEMMACLYRILSSLVADWSDLIQSAEFIKTLQSVIRNTSNTLYIKKAERRNSLNEIEYDYEWLVFAAAELVMGIKASQSLAQ